LARFAAEYLVGAGISHPNVCRATACGVAAGLPFLLLEYMPSTVESLISSGPVDEELAVNIIMQAARGVGTLHELSVAHGDLKPSNLLYDPETGAVKVCDFGSVAIAGSWFVSNVRAVRTVTLAFAAPEQLLTDGAASPATDVYSLGLVLLQLLSGRHPLDGMPASEIAAAHERGLTWDSTRLSPSIRAVLVKSLEREPHRRFRSAGELFRALAHIASGGAKLWPANTLGSHETLEAHSAVTLAQLCAKRGWNFALAARALSESMRTAAASSHKPHIGRCAVVLHVRGIKQHAANPGTGLVTVTEQHTTASCWSGPSSIRVTLGDRRKSSNVRRIDAGAEKRFTWPIGPLPKAVVVRLTKAVLVGIPFALVIAAAWPRLRRRRTGNVFGAEIAKMPEAARDGLSYPRR
jgi:serine/threonine protein kinase